VTRRVITIVGFAAAAVVLVLVIMVGVLFTAPSTSIFGVRSVATGRQTETTYYARHIPGVRTLLESGKIMIESNYIPVEINVSKARQFDELSIQIWEDSTGLSFNSVQRTRIEWSQVLVPRETGGVHTAEVYHKIRVIEPSGVIARNAELVINLPATSPCLYPLHPQPCMECPLPYDFILDTGGSIVTFTSDSVEPLNVGNLEIRNAFGHISLSPTHFNVGNVIVDSRAVTLNCRSTIRGDVTIRCDVGRFTFGDIGGNLVIGGRGNVDGGANRIMFAGANTIGDNAIDCSDINCDEIDCDVRVRIRGNSVIFNSENRGVIVDGDVRFYADNGVFSVARSGHIHMETVNAGLTGIAANGMVSSVNYKATGAGWVNMAHIGNALNGAAEVRIEAVRGNVNVRGVWLNTFVTNRYGTINVEFAAGPTGITPSLVGMPTLTVETYDGRVDARNVVGVTDIFVLANGMARVDARFRQVLGAERYIKHRCGVGRCYPLVNCAKEYDAVTQSLIEYGGSTRRGRVIGNIDVRFAQSIPHCVLEVFNTRASTNRINTAPPNPPMVRTEILELVPLNGIFGNGYKYHINHSDSVSSSGTLRVSTSNTFNLHSYTIP
jgi:hypothetical protein